MQTQVYLVAVALLHLVQTNLPLEGLGLLLELDCSGSSSSSRHRLPHPCLVRLQAHLTLGSLVQEVSILLCFYNLFVDCIKMFIVCYMYQSFKNHLNLDLTFMKRITNNCMEFRKYTRRMGWCTGITLYVKKKGNNSACICFLGIPFLSAALKLDTTILKGTSTTNNWKYFRWESLWFL